MQYFLDLQCSWLLQKQSLLKEMVSPLQQASEIGLRWEPCTGSWGGHPEGLPAEVCFLEPAQGQKQNKGVYTGWCCLTSLAKLPKGSGNQSWRYWVRASRLLRGRLSTLIPRIMQLLEKELACTLPISSTGTANAQLPALEYRLTSQADIKPTVEGLILLEFSFSHLLCQTYQFP